MMLREFKIEPINSEDDLKKVKDFIDNIESQTQMLDENEKEMLLTLKKNMGSYERDKIKEYLASSNELVNVEIELQDEFIQKLQEIAEEENLEFHLLIIKILKECVDKRRIHSRLIDLDNSSLTNK